MRPAPRWAGRQAVATPMIPPPTITTSAVGVVVWLTGSSGVAAQRVVGIDEPYHQRHRLDR